jgi:hypothetical protein
MLDRDNIVQLLRQNDRAVGRALVALAERQTAEDDPLDLGFRAGRGFRHCHTRLGTNMAKFFQEHGHLSPGQLAYWRERQRDGRSRIEVYANQLLDISREKAKNASKYDMITEPIYVEARVVDDIPNPVYNSRHAATIPDFELTDAERHQLAEHQKVLAIFAELDGMQPLIENL